MADFDPWESPLEDVANEVMDRLRRLGPPGPGESRSGPGYSAWLMRIVEVRTALEASHRQRQAMEAQTEKTESLVRWTIALAVATIVLAAAAIVALIAS